MLLTASPERAISPPHRWLWKDPGRGLTGSRADTVRGGEGPCLSDHFGSLVPTAIKVRFCQ